MARVQFINNDGGGFAEFVEIREGETIKQFLTRQNVTNFNNYHIRLRTQAGGHPLEVAACQVLSEGNVVSAVAKPGTVSAGQALNDGARVTVTPKNVTGALFEKLPCGDFAPRS